MKDKYEALIEKSLATGATEAKLIDTDQVVFDPRSHLKCRFGCKRWGRYWTCPPHMALSQEAFMEAFQHYKKAVVIKTDDPNVGQTVALAVEKEAMLSFGDPFALALALCVMCEPCAYPDPCVYPHLARPTMDAYGMDIGKTLQPLQFRVEFAKDGSLLPAWYSMVLLD